MDKQTPQPYRDYLWIEPVENKQVLGNSLRTIGKVLAAGPLVNGTVVGDYVAFELWDKPEFTLESGVVCHFVKESDCVCKLV